MDIIMSISESIKPLIDMTKAIDFTTFGYGLTSSLVASGCIHGTRRYIHRPRVSYTKPKIQVTQSSKADMLQRMNYAP